MGSLHSTFLSLFISDVPWTLIPTGFLIIAITWISGRLISGLISKEPVFDGHIGIGIVVVSAIVAIILTALKTIFICVIPALILVLFIRRKRILINFAWFTHKLLEEIGVLFGFFLFVFFLQFFILHKGPQDWAVNYTDNYFYINQINLLHAIKVESHSSELANLYYGIKVSPRPYHFVEMWPAVYAKILSGCLGYFVFNFFLLPYLASIALFQNFKVLRFKFGISVFYAIIISLMVFTTLRYVILDEFLFLFLKKIGIETIYSKFVFFQNYGFWHFFSYKFGMKLLVSAIFITPVVYYIYEKKPSLVWVYCGILPVMSMVYFPFAVVVSAVQLMLYFKRPKIWLSVLPILSIIWLQLFYMVFGKNDEFGTINYSLNELLNFAVNKLSHPFGLFFNTITGLFSNYYWVFFPLFICKLFFGQNKKYLNFIIIWFLAYPLIGISFDILFKLYVIVGFLLIFLMILSHRKTRIPSSFLSLLLIFGLLQAFELVFPKFMESHQIYALTIPPIAYILCILFWGRFLKNLNFSLVPACLILLFFGFNLFAVSYENNRSFVTQPMDRKFLSELFLRLAPDKKIKSVYCSSFTLMPFVNYDRVGDELTHYTDNFITTVFSVELLTRADTIQAKKIGSFSYHYNLPIAHYIRGSRAKNRSLDHYKLQFLKDNKINFLFRKNNYERSRLNGLNPWIVDSAYNHQMDYQVLKLDWEKR